MLSLYFLVRIGIDRILAQPNCFDGEFIYSVCVLQFSFVMMFEPYFKSRKRGNEV